MRAAARSSCKSSESRIDTGTPYPRRLSVEELSLLDWLLPSDRAGYRYYRERIESSVVLGNGRWGEGDYILGRDGDIVDLSGPMERVFAFGVVEYATHRLNVTVHEEAAEQIEVQFATIGNASEGADETRRYCFSYWNPGDRSPKTNGFVREIAFASNATIPAFILCIAREDEKLWLFDAASGVNHLVPLTNFHNELMLHLRVRDPKYVHRPKDFFALHESYADADLIAAFIRYNRSWKKVELPVAPVDVSSPVRKGIITRMFGN